jgi:hypothetical protein
MTQRDAMLTIDGKNGVKPASRIFEAAIIDHIRCTLE